MLWSSVNPRHFDWAVYTSSQSVFIITRLGKSIMKHIPFGDGHHGSHRQTGLALTRSHQVVFFLYFSAKDGSMTNSASTWEITWELFGYVWRLILIQDIQAPSIAQKVDSKSSKSSKGGFTHGFSSPESMDSPTNKKVSKWAIQQPTAARIGSSNNATKCVDLKKGITHCWQKNLNHWKRLFSSEHGVASGQHTKIEKGFFRVKME